MAVLLGTSFEERYSILFTIFFHDIKLVFDVNTERFSETTSVSRNHVKASDSACQGKLPLS